MTCVDGVEYPKEVLPLIHHMRSTFDEIMGLLQEDEERLRRGFAALQREREMMHNAIHTWRAKHPALPSFAASSQQPSEAQPASMDDGVDVHQHEVSEELDDAPGMKDAAPSSYLHDGLAKDYSTDESSWSDDDEDDFLDDLPPREQLAAAGDAGAPFWSRCEGSAPGRGTTQHAAAHHHSRSSPHNTHARHSTTRAAGHAATTKQTPTPSTISQRRPSIPTYATPLATTHDSHRRNKKDDDDDDGSGANRAAPSPSPSLLPHHQRPQAPASFWIHVWPCFGSSTLASRPIRVCVFGHYRYMEDITEWASRALQCQPAPPYLFEAHGCAVRGLGELVPERHYLLFPSGAYYRKEAVPPALLNELVKTAKTVLLEARSHQRQAER